jgi:hypothetical protein
VPAQPAGAPVDPPPVADPGEVQAAKSSAYVAPGAPVASSSHTVRWIVITVVLLVLVAAGVYAFSATHIFR